jgi:alpha-beta hydrolase superfamily lysophospholipase
VIGVPFLSACVGVYRPKVQPAVDPRIVVGARFDPIDFRTTDGFTLRGWWIPGGAPHQPQNHQTILLCHGFGPGKSSLLPMAKTFVEAGFNVLLFDFRSHGASDGQLTAYGAAEYRDVLAAVRWARDRHANETRKLFGVGIDFGSAALITAAADKDPSGQAIDAVASIGGFDRFHTFTRSFLAQIFLSPLDRIVGGLGTPIASALVGENLGAFSPAANTNGLWPRPIFFIQGEDDEIVQFELGQDLANSAPHPKRRVWTVKQSHHEVADDDDVAKMIIQFFNRARPDPVI